MARSVYVHIPFCRAKCAYCDFNSYAGQERLIPFYVDALLREAAFWARSDAVDIVDTLYVGGGTPSLLPASEVERLMAGLRAAFRFADNAELSIEANPESVDETYLRALRDAGFNRLSLGVQSFDDAELRLLGRIHDARQALEAYAAARNAEFENVNIDLMLGLPGQSLAEWSRSLEQALSLAAEHLSLYALTLEEGTPLARRVDGGECEQPDADTQADMYAWSCDRLAAAGYEQYEISNWARPGHRCRHNLTYWRNEPYLGLGAGAHSRIGDRRFANEPQPERYIQQAMSLEAKDPARLPQITSSERLDAATDMADSMILGLRLVEGVPFAGFRQRFGVDVDERYGREIAELTVLGLIEASDGHLRLTARGRLLGNEAFQRFLP